MIINLLVKCVLAFAIGWAFGNTYGLLGLIPLTPTVILMSEGVNIVFPITSKGDK